MEDYVLCRVKGTRTTVKLEVATAAEYEKSILKGEVNADLPRRLLPRCDMSTTGESVVVANLEPAGGVADTVVGPKFF